MRPVPRAGLAARGLRRAGRGFSLVELLVVVAILGVLGALAVPVLGRVKSKARDTQCLNNLRQMGTAMLLYVGEKGFFPVSFETGSGSTNNWQIEIAPYLANATAVKRCPAAVVPDRGASHYSLNQNVFYDPNNPVARFRDPKRSPEIETPGELILIMDGLQNAAGDAQGGMTQFRGSDGPGQRDVVVTPFQNQAADGGAGGGFPSYRHDVRSGTDRAAQAVFADGHAAAVRWGTVRNRNLVFKVRAGP